MKLQGNFCTILEIMATIELEVEIIAFNLQCFCFVMICVLCSFQFCKLRTSFKFSMERRNKFGFQRLGHFQVKFFKEVCYTFHGRTGGAKSVRSES